MTYFLDAEERWPDFRLIKSQRGQLKQKSIALTDAEYAEWLRIRKAYDAWQRRFLKQSRKSA